MVLIVGLVMLLLLTIVGLAGMQTSSLQERMAGSLLDRAVAFQAAEAGVMEAADVVSQLTTPAALGSNGFMDNQEGGGRVIFWEEFDWDGEGIQADITELEALPSLPRYVIEEMPTVSDCSMGAVSDAGFGELSQVRFYRITSRAVGLTADAEVVLQATYKRCFN